MSYINTLAFAMKTQRCRCYWWWWELAPRPAIEEEKHGRALLWLIKPSPRWSVLHPWLFFLVSPPPSLPMCSVKPSSVWAVSQQWLQIVVQQPLQKAAGLDPRQTHTPYYRVWQACISKGLLRFVRDTFFYFPPSICFRVDKDKSAFASRRGQILLTGQWGEILGAHFRLQKTLNAFCVYSTFFGHAIQHVWISIQSLMDWPDM